MKPEATKKSEQKTEVNVQQIDGSSKVLNELMEKMRIMDQKLEELREERRQAPNEDRNTDRDYGRGRGAPRGGRYRGRGRRGAGYGNHMDLNWNRH